MKLTVDTVDEPPPAEAASNSQRSMSPNNLTHTQTRQSEGQAVNLHETIASYRQALELRSTPHPDHFTFLNEFGNALVTQFRHSGQREDLDVAISLHQEALELRPHPDRSTSLTNLGNALTARFGQSGQREDIDKAISFHRQALEPRAAPHPDRFMFLNNLGIALVTRFQHSGQWEDLGEAISFNKKALELLPPSHPDRSGCLNNLAVALWTKFKQSGQWNDLDEAISCIRQVLQLLPDHHPLRSTIFNNLGNALTTRFEHSGQQEDLDGAISCNQRALELRPTPHPFRSMSLNNLGNALSTRFEQSGQREDLDKAISFYRQVLELRATPHPDRSTSLTNLGDALMTRYEQSGQWEDLDEAISFIRQALELLPEPHPVRPTCLNNLGKVLMARFEQSGRQEDLDEVISTHQEALELRPAPNPDRSMSLNNLGNALSTRFEQSGQREDLDKAISFHRQALELRPAPHPARSMSLNNLGDALTTRFGQLRQQDDLGEAVSFHSQALELRPALHPLRPTSLYNLGRALMTRFQQSGQRKDLDEAIIMYSESMNTVTSIHPSFCEFSAGLGQALMCMYTHTHDSGYLDNAMATYRAGVTCGSAPASMRFHAAKLWAYHADYADSTHESSLDAYQAAIELLPRLAMLGLDLQARQQALTSGSDGLARDAAACAIRSGQYDKAVELLEEGRAVFWSQALQLRTSMTDLRDTKPELEDKLRHISDELERGSLRNISRNPSDTPLQIMSFEQKATHFHHLNDKWLATLEEVRQLDGFQDFLSPSRLSTLQNATADGSVVILNAGKTDCAALILTSTGVRHAQLPDLRVTILVDLIRHAITQNCRNALLPKSNRAHVEGLVRQMPFLSDTVQMLRLPFERHVGRVSDTSVQSDDIFRYVLAALWVSVVEPVVRLLELKKSDVSPRLWWCPTGPFTFLPIHAAGIYLADGTECISDYVVSSYTPTISSLLGNLPLPTKSFKMMVVIQPDTPGQKSLPCTLDELQKIEAHVPNKNLVRLVRRSVKEAISHLPAASIAHFACHGQQHAQNPLESALILQDGKMKISQIMGQSMPTASLAFLSACETAMGDENLPDEVIHLGATLLFAGFRGVVATMWSISDVDGPKIADTFYEALFNGSTMTNGSGVDTTQAARALHLAVAKLRSENTSFVRWVPFIHLGR